MRFLTILSLIFSVTALLIASPAALEFFRYGSFGGEAATTGFVFGFLLEIVAFVLLIVAILTILIKKHRNRAYLIPKLSVIMAVTGNILAGVMFLPIIFLMIIAAGSVM